MCNISGRLLEERKRLGLSQDKMAKVGGVAKRTYCNYEAGDRDPMGSFFAAIAKEGADVQYILTGVRSAAVTPREKALLDNYLHTDEQGKNIIEATASAAAQPSQEKRRA
jgi:transcriptional regulator with XRE-family HTH domain